MSQVVVIKSDNYMQVDYAKSLKNPKELLYYNSLDKGREKLTVKQRLALLRQELEELEQDVQSEVDPQPLQIANSYLAEVNNIAGFRKSSFSSFLKVIVSSSPIAKAQIQQTFLKSVFVI